MIARLVGLAVCAPFAVLVFEPWQLALWVSGTLLLGRGVESLAARRRRASRSARLARISRLERELGLVESPHIVSDRPGSVVYYRPPAQQKTSAQWQAEYERLLTARRDRLK